MSDPGAAINASREEALRALSLSGVRIYRGKRPTNAVMPYVFIGQDQVVPETGEDDECVTGHETFATGHIYTQDDQQARSIAAAAGPALRDITVPGHNMVVREYNGTDFTTEATGVTHGVMQHRYLTNPSE